MKPTAGSLSSLRNIRVVLVRTRYAGNVGATARAIQNMGITDLRLVQPETPLDEEAWTMAARAREILERATVYPSLAEAVAGCGLVVGTTSLRGRKVRQPVYAPRQLSAQIVAQASGQPVALVFGPERVGLKDAELARCQYLVSIPASRENPVLNLAQAVLLVSYELFLAAETARPGRVRLAEQEEREAMFEHMERVLVRIGFLSSSNPGHIMKALRRLFGASPLTSRDIRILRGIFSQMEWFASEGHQLPAERVIKR